VTPLLKPALILALVAALLAASLAGAEVVQKGDVRVDVSGQLDPTRLPRTGSAPVSVAVGGKIASVGESATPTLKTLKIELNRNGRIDYRGLPVCPYDVIQPASSQRALSGCRRSLVGRGSFTAEIALAGQQPYPTKGKLLAFNGRDRGKPVLFGHIYAPRPFATSFVIVFAIDRGRGKFGTALTAALPPSLRTWGNLTGIELKLSRRYSSGGERHSYLSAGCPAPKGFAGATFPFARTSFGFEGGLVLSTTLTRSCKAKG
jgi:hypothetical protein